MKFAKIGELSEVSWNSCENALKKQKLCQKVFQNDPNVVKPGYKLQKNQSNLSEMTHKCKK
jgi:hypothetical protein